MWLTIILLALFAPPAFGLVLFLLYRLATSSRPGFWVLTVLWALGLTAVGFCLLRAALAPNSPHYLYFSRGDWFLMAAMIGVPLLVLVGIPTLIRSVVLSRRRSRSEPSHVGLPPASRRAEVSPPSPGFWLACIGWVLYALAAAGVGIVLTVEVGTASRPWEEAIGFFAVLGVLLLLLTAVRYTWINRRRWAAAVSYAHPVGGTGVVEVAEPLPSKPTTVPSGSSTGKRIAWIVLGVAVLGCGGLMLIPTGATTLKPVSHIVNGVEQLAPDPSAVVDAGPQVVAMPLLVAGGAVVAVVIGVGVVVVRAAGRPKRKLTPQELDELVKSVPPLSPERRKAMFWICTLVMTLAAISLVGAVFEQMGAGCFSFVLAFFILSSALSSVLVTREWAFKKKPADSGMSPAGGPPLAVAPVILTPDPTPAKGNCPTCGGPIPAGSPQGLCPRCLIRGVMPSVNATRARSVRPIDPPPAAEVNEFFPHLEVLELVGAGGMGAVYKARQPNLDRVVALKIVQSPTGEDDPVFAERFAREARAMAKLDHPNIVTIYESGEAGGLPYMLMEFVDGITLRDAMEHKVLTTAEALAVIPQICDALDYAHRTGVVHRDIKPENILVDQTGRVKIADFGLAKLAEAGGLTLTHTRQAMGTPHYMAPEQWEKPNEVDHRADIYALGVVLYELLTGELPLGRFDLPSAKGKGNPRLDQVVLRALAKEPGQRYQHASDLKGALSGVGNWWDGLPPRHGFYEFRSKRSFLGWPLVHVVRGRDPATGRLKVAKGWIAVGDGLAVGGVAVGGTMAVGGVSVGGALSIGLLAIGGAMGIGLLALGGVAMGLAVAAGGVAISAGLAIGGVAIGTFAIGGAAVGQHTLGGTGNTPEFWEQLRLAIPNNFRWRPSA